MVIAGDGDDSALAAMVQSNTDGFIDIITSETGTGKEVHLRMLFMD